MSKSKYILCFGDSITQGFWDDKGGWVDRLKQVELANGINEKPFKYIFNLGISGENSTELLGRFEQEITSRHKENNDTVIIIAIGINDSSISHGKQRVPVEVYRQNLDKIAKVAKKYANQIFFLEITPVDEARACPVAWGDHYYENQQIEKYNKTLRSVAQKHDFPVVAAYDKFVEAGASDLLHDGLHPNTAGHRLLYDLINSALIKYDINF